MALFVAPETTVLYVIPCIWPQSMTVGDQILGSSSVLLVFQCIDKLILRKAVWQIRNLLGIRFTDNSLQQTSEIQWFLVPFPAPYTKLSVLELYPFFP